MDTEAALTPEFLALVARVDISTPTKLAAFEAWKLSDGSIDGLRELVKQNEGQS